MYIHIYVSSWSRRKAAKLVWLGIETKLGNDGRQTSRCSNVCVVYICVICIASRRLMRHLYIYCHHKLNRLQQYARNGQKERYSASECLFGECGFCALFLIKTSKVTPREFFGKSFAYISRTFVIFELRGTWTQKQRRTRRSRGHSPHAIIRNLTPFFFPPAPWAAYFTIDNRSFDVSMIVFKTIAISHYKTRL